MSTEADKLKHSRRLLKDDNAINKQLKIAKAAGHTKYLKEPHRLAKHHAMDCGQPGCVMCGNPRKAFNEKTIQEQRFDQTSKWQESDD
jgi:hypothetical protein